MKHYVAKIVVFNEIKIWLGDFVHFLESENVETSFRVQKIPLQTNEIGELKNKNKNSEHENVT
jgi:hypothetical protein